MDIDIRITTPGGPAALEVTASEAREPAAGEIRLRQQAIGVSFIDIYHRAGLYPLAAPGIPGVEGAGIVEAVGPGVEDLRVGERVVYAGAVGGYATTRCLPAWRAVRLPDDVPMEIAATSMLRGLTTHMLFHATCPVGAGSVLLVHAVAGGLGIILTRWAARLGARVIGTASTPQKAAAALANGADHVIVGRDADIAAEVMRLTGGAGVDLVIDGIGGAMLRTSLRCARPFGAVASIGWVAGGVPPIAIEELGLASLSKPSVMAYSADPARYVAAAETVIEAFRSGIVGDVGGRYPLGDAADAHRALEGGQTQGGLVLLP
ncbi:alcohol dehydrogenase [Acuticoccus sediminis]|uniref:Alcohol dehydrogenase n=1 Tax=Acuticoccus sediminis TaxID=2184697 RepID=A0A8B2NRK6_9HYPH|nr:quinone oxidoreductase [Acuticoccus sediminis]RAI01531.1 alcohol dehydrogenase [Acuticoccus sediminis]